MPLNRAIPLVLLVLAGCATSKRWSGARCRGVTGNAVSVIVSNVWNEMDAFPLAEKHCQSYGKSARFNRFAGNKASFD